MNVFVAVCLLCWASRIPIPRYFVSATIDVASYASSSMRQCITSYSLAPLPFHLEILNESWTIILYLKRTFSIHEAFS